MTEELKPCPAGHDAEIVQHPDGTTYSPQCADWNCAWGIDEEFSDPETAAKFWNTRADSEEVERLRAENKMLRAELIEAVDDIESWGAYAPSYFAEKWDLTGNLERHRKVLAQLPEES